MEKLKCANKNNIIKFSVEMIKDTINYHSNNKEKSDINI